jgi:exodeoxyribonuclease-5
MINLGQVKDLKDNYEDPYYDVSSLKPGQAQAFNRLQEFALGHEKMMVISGYAGTGKTYLIATFLKWYVSDRKLPILITAPTNKAVKVLRAAAGIDNAFVAYSTIHSALALKEFIGTDGKVSFKPDKTANEVPIESYQFVVIDESSMLSDELYSEVKLHVQRGLKVLFVGDPKQIPPVGQAEALPFDEKKRKSEGMVYFQLDEIIRQAKGNPIIDLTLLVRERPNYRKSVLDLLVENQISGISLLPSDVVAGLGVDVEGVGIVDSGDEDAGDGLHAFLEARFKSEEFKEDADYIKVVAWRNVVVDYFNKYIREMIYGEGVGKIMVGEKMIANKPILSDDGTRVIFSTNEEFEVTNFEVKHYNNHLGFECDYYSVDVKYLKPNGDWYHANIPIIHENSEDAHKEWSEELKSQAKKQPGGSYQAKQAWVKYYEFLKIFADVKYNYAITAHKSQGSTYRNCVIMDYDLSRNNKVVERNRIKYTSASRASKFLLVVS